MDTDVLIVGSGTTATWRMQRPASREEFLAFLRDTWRWQEVGANLEKEATS